MLKIVAKQTVKSKNSLSAEKISVSRIFYSMASELNHSHRRSSCDPDTCDPWIPDEPTLTLNTSQREINNPHTERVCG